MAFYWPESMGEWLAWSAAVITLLFGSLMFLMPRTMLRAFYLEPNPKHLEAVSEARSTIGGFYIGLALSAIAFRQPLLWVALGVCWGLAALGRLISILSDNGSTVLNWLLVVVQVLLAACALASFSGYVQ